MIRLSTNSRFEGVRQRVGVRLSETLHTEEQIALHVAEDHLLVKKDKRRSGVLFLLFFVLYGAANAVASDHPIGCIALFAVALVFLLSAAFFFISTGWGNTEVPLTSRLADHPQLCGQLNLLAKGSAAVNTYVKSVNASGRQLRVFDLAKANLLVREEAHSTTACAELHSR